MTEFQPGAAAPPVASSATPIAKIPSGIAGLDEILHGGLPLHRTTMISGGPGTGKTVMGLQFLVHGARNGEPGIFVTMEERAEGIRENARSLGWDLETLEREGKLFVLDARLDPGAVLSGAFDLKGLLAILGGQAEAMGATRIVIDALDLLVRLFSNPAEARNQVYALHEWLADKGFTVILTAKAAADGQSLQPYDFLDFLADCVIFLDNRVSSQLSTRRLRVIKCRGSDFGHGECPYIITQKGIKFIPRSGVDLAHAPLGEHISTGLPELDEILGGGIRRASCTLVSGTTGTGKTTTACTYAIAACKRGERVLYLDFEESREALISGMLSTGLDLRPAADRGCLCIMATMPEAVGAEEHLIRVVAELDEFRPQHVILDAVSSVVRMGNDQAAFDFLVRLVNQCKERAITVLLVNQTAGFMDPHEITGVGISSLVDTVIMLRYVESGGEINRMMLVLKSRGSAHSNQYREYHITGHGIVFAELFGGEGGATTGAARQEQETRQALERRRRDQELRALEAQVVQRRAARDAQLAQLEAEIAMVQLELENRRLESQMSEASRSSRLRIRGAPIGNDETPPALPGGAQ